ncbi:MAG: CspA family cold shock protein [Acetobacteraceae bacterium]|nr:CspA family cold shock protein [Acetobacteraceae bacterium]
MRTPDRRSFDSPRRGGRGRDDGFGGSGRDRDFGGGRDFGGPSRDFGAPSRDRGFGSPFGGSRMPSSPPGPETGAVVKWFNAEKGFGFVELEGGAGDAFLHVSVLSRLGYSTVQPGTPMRVRTSAGQKGPQIAEVVSVEEGVTLPTSSPPPRPRTPRPPPDLSATTEMRGTVKWFNPEKGFGFVMPEGGGKDVFVHISALGRGGLTTLEPNQAVRLQVAEGRRGPEAVSVEPA